MIINNIITLCILTLFLLFLIIKIFSCLNNNIFLNFISTPLILLIIIILTLYSLYNNPSIYSFLISLGLITSLVGDIFNLFEKHDNSHLVYSISFFFFTHLLYLSAFITRYIFSIFHFIPLIIISIIIIILYNKFKINNKFIKIGILIYMFLISITLVIAISNFNNSLTLKSLFCLLGMLLFWVSDLFLGIDGFINKIKYSTIIIWGLYAPGQLLIALSCYH